MDFIKMDAEGAETRVIAGASNTNKPRLAITTEHGPDDERTIPQAVRKVRSDYQLECGPCLEANGHIRADVFYSTERTPALWPSELEPLWYSSCRASLQVAANGNCGEQCLHKMLYTRPRVTETVAGCDGLACTDWTS